MTQPFRSCLICTSLTVAMLASSVGPLNAQTLGSAPAQTLPGIDDLFRDTAADFKQLATKESATWLTLGLVGVSLAHSLDQPTSSGMSRSIGAERVFASGERIGGARYQLAGALATYTLGRVTGHSKMAAVGADLVSANIVAQVVTSGIKLAVQRDRPDGTEYSFPSGHASVSFAAATVIQRHFGWSGGIPAYAAASFVAASRIQEKRHYLSDVAFGAVIGIVSGRAVTVGSGNHRFAVEPMVPASGGAGIAFVKK